MPPSLTLTGATRERALFLIGIAFCRSPSPRGADKQYPPPRATVLLVGLGFVLVNVVVDLVLIRLVPRATSAA